MPKLTGPPEAVSAGEGITHYERAASGGDPSLRAIALYKSGWAHYTSDRFAAALAKLAGFLQARGKPWRIAERRGHYHFAGTRVIERP